MNKTLQKEIKAYQKNIRQRLPWLNRQKRSVLREIFAQMADFSADTPEATIADIRQQFGTPEIVAASILSQEEAAILKKQNKKLLIASAVILLMAIVLAFLCAILYGIYDNKDNYHYYTDPEIIQPIEPNEGED